MPDALKEVQHGGRHYKGMAIQPVEFAYANRWDACAFSVLKYVSRHHDKAGRLDLEKAAHFVDLRRDLNALCGPCPMSLTKISMDRYVTKNNIGRREGSILFLLDSWTRLFCVDDQEMASTIRTEIERLIIVTYGEN